MRLLFWLLIFSYYANIYAPEIEESHTPDIEETPEQDIEETPEQDIEETPEQDIEKPLDFWEYTEELAKIEDRRESNPFDALLILGEGSTKHQTSRYYLPDEVQVNPIDKSKGKGSGPSSSTTRQNFELIFLKKGRTDRIQYLCAADIQRNTQHKRVIEKSTKHYSGFQYCLFKTAFPENMPIRCRSEAIPLVVPILSTEYADIVNCGPNQAYDFLQFAYPYCWSTRRLDGLLDHIGKQLHEIDDEIGEPDTELQDDVKPLFTADHPMLQLYRICFDTSNIRVVYMHHRIFPSLVKNENQLTNLNYVNMSSKISPPSKEEKNAGSPIIPAFPKSQPIPGQQLYHEKFPKYSNMKKAFANQASAEYPMKPQMLVPTADMPFALWKKSTFSYINIAPLWDQLVPLMDLINDRIRQFAIKRSKKLSIYSAAFDVNFGDYEKLYLDEEKELPVPTVWGKLVHDEVGETATLILLHNTPDHDFKSSRLCAGTEEVPCNFIDWWQTSSQKNIIDETVIKETSQYAYCCQVRTTNIIPEYYGIPDIKIKGDIVNIE